MDELIKESVLLDIRGTQGVFIYFESSTGCSCQLAWVDLVKVQYFNGDRIVYWFYTTVRDATVSILLFESIGVEHELICTDDRTEVKNYDFKPISGNVGRPRVVEYESIQILKSSGKTQEQIARELNISLSTVRRNWKNDG